MTTLYIVLGVVAVLAAVSTYIYVGYLNMKNYRTAD